MVDRIRELEELYDALMKAREVDVNDSNLYNAQQAVSMAIVQLNNYAYVCKKSKGTEDEL